MAEIKLLAQGLIENHDHLSAVKELLQLENTIEIFISVAFVRKSGVTAIAETLANKKDIAKIYIGIRNEVTSIQAIIELLKLNIHPYVIDVATTKRLYHPKIYAAFSNSKVDVIIGSANLTASGLNHNYEASSYISLDTELDKEYIFSLKNAFFYLENRFPENVIKISTIKDAVKLLRDGLVEDERIIRVSQSQKLKTKNNSILRKPMPSKTRTITSSLKTAITPKQKNRFSNNYILVWESKELTERDLNIPTGNNTNATGSMYFKKGLMKDIDQRHYFRDEVFNGLVWSYDANPSKKHLERATAKFEIVIKGVSYGIYNLKLTHNTDTNSKTYLQNNAMTQIHWGEIKNFIAKRELLGEKITLYSKGNNNFLLTIS